MGYMPKIGGLQNAAYFINKDAAEPDYNGVSYVPKVKLHGTNASICVTSGGRITPRSKKQDLKIGEDNFGFAAFIDTLNHSLLRDSVRYAFGEPCDNWDEISIVGEWAGPGIQKGVAISGLEDKTFFIFAVFVTYTDEAGEQKYVHYDSNEFWELAEELRNRIKRFVFLATNPKEEVGADWRVQAEKQEFVDRCNRYVAEIEEQCPVSSWYNLEGIGEGAVYYPHTVKGWITYETFKNYTFKVKGEKHATSKAGKPARVKSNIADGAHDFVDMHVTDARLEQALQETGNDLSNANIGPMIKWVANDVMAECAQEIEEAGLEWKRDLSGLIATRTRLWFQTKQQEV